MRRFSSMDRSAARPISAALMAVRASDWWLPVRMSSWIVLNIDISGLKIQIA